MTNIEKLVKAFKESLMVEENIIVDNLEYNSIVEWDSVAHMSLVGEIENIFDIMLDTDDIIDISSFAKAKEILQKYDVRF